MIGAIVKDDIEMGNNPDRMVLFVVYSIPLPLIQKAIEKGKNIPESFKIASLDHDRIVRVGDILTLTYREAKVWESQGLGEIIKEL